MRPRKSSTPSPPPKRAWGLDGVPPAVEISVPLGGGPQLEGVTVHRPGRLDRPDVERHGPVPRTSAARTIIDLAAVVPAPVVSRALDDALARRLVTCGYLERRLDALGRQGRTGAGTLAKLLTERSGGRARHESEFERRLFSVLTGGGLPAPETQVEVRLPTGRLAGLDLPTATPSWPSRPTVTATTRAGPTGPVTAFGTGS